MTLARAPDNQCFRGFLMINRLFVNCYIDQVSIPCITTCFVSKPTANDVLFLYS